MNRLTLTTTLSLLTGATLTACTPDSAHNAVAARNNCNTPIQVEDAVTPNQIGFYRNDVEPGKTLYLGTSGDVSTIYVRVGSVLDDPEARLDESLPILTYKPDELLIATPEEEKQDGYEFYFIIEGDLCP